MVDIIFRGDIVPGQNILAVKAAMQARFKLAEAEIDKLFSGKPVVIKKGLGAQEAEDYQSLLNSLGALVSLAEREVVVPDSPVSADTSGLTTAEVGEDVLKPEERKNVPPVEVDFSGISLSPEGVDVLDDKDKKPFTPADVDTSHISLE